jgi:hypothetical protein
MFEEENLGVATWIVLAAILALVYTVALGRGITLHR